MIAADRDALICDLAETYNILDWRALPVSMLATLSVGLRDDSRIKLHMSGSIPCSDMLLAAAVDRLSLLVWANTKDGQNGIGQPTSILSVLLGETQDNNRAGFESPMAFEQAWGELTGVYHG